jgi:hypothetical protein
MPRQHYLTHQEVDLIYENEYKKLREIKESMEPCDLYDVCQDCPNWNVPAGCQGEERKAA